MTESHREEDLQREGGPTITTRKWIITMMSTVVLRETLPVGTITSTRIESTGETEIASSGIEIAIVTSVTETHRAAEMIGIVTPLEIDIQVEVIEENPLGPGTRWRMIQGRE